MIMTSVRVAVGLIALVVCSSAVRAAQYTDRQMLAIINTTVDMLNDPQATVRLNGLGDLVEVMRELHENEGVYGIYMKTVPKFLPGLKAMIERDPQPKVRQEAARTLQMVLELFYNHTEQRVGFPLHPVLDDMVPFIIKMGKHPETAVRYWGVKILGVLMPPDAKDTLIGLLRDPDAGVRLEALKALSTFYTDERIAPAAAEALKDPQVDVRVQAAQSLGAFADPDTLPALLAAVEDASLLVRRSVIGALGAFRDPRVVAVLEKGLTDPDPWIKRAALGGLGGKNPQGWALLERAQRDSDPGIRRTVFDVAVQGGTPGLVIVIRSLQDPNFEIWSRASDAIRRLDLPSPPFDAEQAKAAWAALKPVFTHRESAVRLAAVAAAAWCHKEDALPLVRQALKDPDVGVREVAKKSLGLLGEMETDAFELRP